MPGENDSAPRLQDGKPKLRAWAKERRASLDMPSLSAAITARLAALPEYEAARSVLLYLPTPSEVDVTGLIERSGGRRGFLVPCCAGDRRLSLHPYVPGVTPLVVGAFGIREPDSTRVPAFDPTGVDLAVVPALLLAEDGRRLGYGGGYYDRLLPTLPPGTVCVGALPEALVLPTLPSDPWDVPMDVIVTEARVIRPSTL